MSIPVKTGSEILQDFWEDPCLSEIIWWFLHYTVSIWWQHEIHFFYPNSVSQPSHVDAARAFVKVLAPRQSQTHKRKHHDHFAISRDSSHSFPTHPHLLLHPILAWELIAQVPLQLYRCHWMALTRIRTMVSRSPDLKVIVWETLKVLLTYNILHWCLQLT